MRYALYVLLHGLLLAFCGCASRGNVELLESELRQQEDRYYALQHELRAVRSELAVAREETELLRTRHVNHSGTALLPEQTRPLVRMSELGISKLFTGGLDRDNQPGDEAFVVLLNPLDSDGEVIKLPGQVDIVLLDFARNEDGEPIGRWSFTAEQTRERWHAGLSQGFLFRLPWQETPVGSKLIVHARLTTVDGRDFLASHQFEITPPSGSAAPRTQLALPPVPPAELPEQAADEPELMPFPLNAPVKEVAIVDPELQPTSAFSEPKTIELVAELPVEIHQTDSEFSEPKDTSEETELEEEETATESAPPFPVHLDALEKAKLPSEAVELPFAPMPTETPDPFGTASVELTVSNPKDNKPAVSADWKPTSQKTSESEDEERQTQ